MITTEGSVPFESGVRQYYRMAVATLVDESGDAVSTQDAKDLASKGISIAINKGEIAAPDVMTQIMSELKVADDKDKRSSDSMISALLYGQQHLPLRELLDTVVVLGAGMRKPWAQITWNDMETMDEIRYANMEKQQMAYQEWRPKFHMIRNALRDQGLSIEQILDDGPLMPMGDE